MANELIRACLCKQPTGLALSPLLIRYLVAGLPNTHNADHLYLEPNILQLGPSSLDFGLMPLHWVSRLLLGLCAKPQCQLGDTISGPKTGFGEP